ncbi:hypothetical protein BBP40_004369 [Aspergillus hancockii]|nr:hypothetical protein BBP40_004369 [Aspergillus hancockii]
MENANSIRSPQQETSASTVATELGPDVPGAAQQDAVGTVPGDAPAQKAPRKRTKTGCLTCRQRRIKCGEEKPVCNNCVKSKRECKGYAQRLIFKNPLGIPGASNLQQVISAAPAMDSSWVSYPSPPMEQQQQYVPSHLPVSPAQLTYIEEDDDYYDVESDEEPEELATTQNFNQLSLIMTSANRDERQLRSFTTYLNEPNVLASYQPTLGSSPLNNPKTARIFLHFIHSTGPSLSVFERHPIDPSTMFGAPVPAAQQGLWTYTLPFKALEHPSLLQAILALSSLHISFLQQVSPTVSMKHYHYALKRIGVAVGLPIRRKQVGTLAAALILGYYEVMAADPSKWNNHLAGSAQLVREIDFAGITRDLRAHRRRTWTQRQETGLGFPLAGVNPFGNTFSEDDPFAEKENSIDEGIIGTIVGRAVNYDDFGQVDDGYDGRSYKRHFTRKDIENFRVQCDLYWWFFKQDIIQSLLTGNAMFMPPSQWGQCPPRAGLGKLDAIYGSTDHLWLLLARLSDFGQRDRKRKLMSTIGTGWRPGPELSGFMARFAKGPPDVRARPPSNSPSSTSSAFSGDSVGAQAHGVKSAGPSSWPGGGSQKSVSGKTTEPRQSHNSNPGQQPVAPPMYGMVPTGGPKRLPLAFADAATRGGSPEYDGENDESLSYSEAEQEWESILAAFEAFAHALGPYFRPLPADIAPPISTVFGPALQYRTHTIAAMMGFYYLGRIVLNRLHPSMPPAMMVAAGVAAPTTAEFSQIIGKIATGIYYPQQFNLEAGSLSPTLGSCLIEITIPIFFAAVQYTDTAQREWVVTVLRDVSRLTGWKSSEAIANGCETAWRAAANQGRGPPYHPPDAAAPHQPPAWMSATESQGYENLERRFVKVKPPYANYAMGIMSLDDDMVNLGIED